MHCAEGRGRTGVMCACYLIYYYDMEPWDAIRIMRRQRPGSVERKVQEETVVRCSNKLTAISRGMWQCICLIGHCSFFSTIGCQVLPAAGRLREGQRGQARPEGEAVDRDAEAAAGRAHEVRTTSFKVHFEQPTAVSSCQRL